MICWFCINDLLILFSNINYSDGTHLFWSFLLVGEFFLQFQIHYQALLKADQIVLFHFDVHTAQFFKN